MLKRKLKNDAHRNLVIACVVCGRICNVWEEISGLNSMLGLVSLLLGFICRTNTLTSGFFIEYIIGSLLVGFLFSRAYLIGANISRYLQFGEMSHKILIHVFLLFVLLFIL